ncbi:MAG: hypothetical protein Q9157_005840 [Trypethelium eluteriae]
MAPIVTDYVHLRLVFTSDSTIIFNLVNTRSPSQSRPSYNTIWAHLAGLTSPHPIAGRGTLHHGQNAPTHLPASIYESEDDPTRRWSPCNQHHRIPGIGELCDAESTGLDDAAKDRNEAVSGLAVHPEGEDGGDKAVRQAARE